jgi:hypothetical protein
LIKAGQPADILRRVAGLEARDGALLSREMTALEVLAHQACYL